MIAVIDERYPANLNVIFIRHSNLHRQGNIVIAALKLGLAGRKVGLIASGGNMTLDQLHDLLEARA